MQFLWNIDDVVLPWACQIINTPMNVFEKPRVLAICSDDGKALAAAIFDRFQPVEGTMQLSFCAASPRWATVQAIKTVLDYPFKCCGVQKLWTATPHTNERALKLNKGLGFKREAVLARHLGRDQHAVVSRMFQEDYLRLWSGDRTPETYGKKVRPFGSNPGPLCDSSSAGCSQ